MSAYEYLYGPAFVSPLKALRQKFEGLEARALSGDTKLLQAIKYGTNKEFLNSLSAPKTFLDRPGVVYRDFCYQNQLEAIDRDPLCIP
jgi:hypothetical protein